MMVRSSLARLGCAYALLVACWIFTDPPFSAPDEWSHYVRALGLEQGQVIGKPVESFRDPSLDPRQQAWVAQTVRWTDVRPGMAPDGYGCNAFRSEMSAACLHAVPPPPRATVRIATVNGTYQPAAYLLPALALHGAAEPVSGILRARAANALSSLALIVLAAAALSPNLLGLAVALTPMALFLAAALNPSGPEIAGGIAFAAGLLALARPDARPQAWSAVAAGGAALCLSRSLGPGWLAMVGGAWLVWLGPAEAWRVCRRSPRAALLSGAILVSSALVNRVWEAMYGPRLPVRTEPLATALRESVRRLPGWFREQVGIFQYLDASMPRFAYVLWGAVILVLFVGAAWVGTRRDRLALTLAAGAAIAVPVLLNVLAMRQIGWVVQGRHVLPLAVLVPLLSAEIVARRRPKLPRLAVFIAAASISVVQFVAVYSNARRSAVGTRGSWLFPLVPEWSPALGWWPWLLLAVAACGILCAVRLVPPAPVQDSRWNGMAAGR